MSPDRVAWEVEAAQGLELAEHPLWDERRECVLWVDVLGGTLHSLSAEGQGGVLPLGGTLGAVGLRREGGFVAAVDHHFAFFDEAGRADRDPVAAPLVRGSRFNDAACDPAGRFFAGTAALDETSPCGLLIRLEPDGSVEIVFEDLIEANGLGWSPDARTFYFVDSGDPRIRRYDYDVERGVIGARRSDLAVFDAEEGVPDGLCVDRDGGLWVALWQGGAIRHYAPDGSLLADLSLPVSRPTCPVLGGPGLSRLYLTTAWQGLSTDSRRGEPLAGHLLSRLVEVPGINPYRFG